MHGIILPEKLPFNVQLPFNATKFRQTLQKQYLTNTTAMLNLSTRKNQTEIITRQIFMSTDLKISGKQASLKPARLVGLWKDDAQMLKLPGWLIACEKKDFWTE